ncbi:MAG: hypothetical protein AB7O68_00910 [Pirellulales bacterium]
MARSRARAQAEPEPEVVTAPPTDLGSAEGPGPVEYGEQIELKPGQDITIGRGGDVVVTPVPKMRGRPKWKPRFKLAPLNTPIFTEPGPAHDFYFESARNTIMGLAINAPWELNNGYGARKPIPWQFAWPAGDSAGSTPVIPHGGLTDYSATIDNAESLIGPMQGWQGTYGRLPYAHELPGESLGPFDEEQVVESHGQPEPVEAAPPAVEFEEVPAELMKPAPEAEQPSDDAAAWPEEVAPTNEPTESERPTSEEPEEDSAAAGPQASDESASPSADEAPSDAPPAGDDGPVLPF